MSHYSYGVLETKTIDMKTERHHCTPVSLQGFDWEENIMVVSVADHKLIHSTMNVNYQKIRTFRRKTNHIIHRNSQAYIRLLKDLHLDFYKNVHKLPLRLQNKMRDCIRDTTKRIIKEHGLSLRTPAHGADLFKWLKSYHYSLLLR